MSDSAPLAPPAMAEPGDVAQQRRAWLPAALALGIGTALLAALAVSVFSSRPPGDDSLEAGFARDMIVHHDQAVAMALLARDRTADPIVKALATDILLTQQNQIGQMLGWLNVWGLPATGTAPPMTWMDGAPAGAMPGMAMDGRMSRLATPEELAQLEAASGDAANRLFLELMIRHHQGAIPMATAAVERSGNAQVRTLAEAIVAAQQSETGAMEELRLEMESSAGTA